jgi:26S proteasome regulatory subunit N3
LDALQQAFHRRITFCLDVHNEAVKSMRFPANNTYKDIQGSGDR